MKLVAISVGRPQEVQWRGRSVQTSIFKTPVSHRVPVTRSNIEGDQQSDLSVHGGPEKAVYAYPAEHYDFWRRELPSDKIVLNENVPIRIFVAGPELYVTPLEGNQLPPTQAGPERREEEGKVFRADFPRGCEEGLGLLMC